MSEPPVMPKRVLVAEDSPVTQDLLKLILTQRGHAVDIADDGEEALGALERTPYDVALIDFRLPKLDGLQVAQRYRTDKNGDARARLIAITADVEGLLAHQENCENFDQIIPKPLDIYEVCNVIEHSADAQAPDWTAGTLEEGGEEAEAVATNGKGAPAMAMRAPMPNWARGLELLRWPEDFSDPRMPGSAIPAFSNLDAIDGILIGRAASVADIAAIWDRRPLHLFPVIDLDGALGRYADFDASLGRRENGEAIRQLIQSFHQRRSELHRDLMTTSDLGEKLLGRLFVQGSGLLAAYEPTERLLIRYNVPLGADTVMREAEKHRRNGFLQQVFFDRFHVCYRCSSSRLHIREECPACRFSQLREESYIHHFKCGNQGVESDFRDGDKLICPKCRLELQHFSVDYDKPGSAIVCGRCGHAESEPIVGFLCMDCAAHFDSDSAASRDIFSYELTAEGTAFLQMGQALRGPGQRTLRFSDLPLDFVVALNAAAKKFNEDKTPFTVLNIAYENEREIIREAGLRQFSQAREQFLENLGNRLRDFQGRGMVVKGHSYDFGLLNSIGPAEAQAHISDLIASASSSIRFDLGPSTQLFGHEDFV